MKVLVILGHQNEGSFNHAIADVVCSELEKKGHEVIFHDLYKEKFDPILPHGEIPKDAEIDPIVKKHCLQVQESDGYVVIHPNWWAQPPAILKGWVDRVFRQGVVYEFTDKGVNGFLKGKTALVITTSNTPKDIELEVFGDPLENLWGTCTFKFCGVENFKRRNFESIVMSTNEQREQWLIDTAALIEDNFPAS